MLTALMIATYTALLAVALAYLIKSLRGLSQQRVYEVTEFRRDIISRVLLMYKVVRTVLKSPTLLIAFAMLSVSMLLTASATQYGLVLTSRDVGHTNFYGIYIRVSEPIPLSNLTEYVSVVGGNYTAYIRYVLSNPLPLQLGNALVNVYAVVGVPSGYVLPNNLVIDDGVLVIGDYNITKPINVNLMGRELQLHPVGRDVVEGVKVFYNTPLLPVEAYLGSKPITIPPERVLIGSINVISALILKSGEALVTDLVIDVEEVGAEGINVGLLADIASKYSATVLVLRDNVLEVLSGVGLPTADSILSALLSALIAVAHSI